MKKLLLVLLIAVVFTACEKESYEIKIPEIEKQEMEADKTVKGGLNVLFLSTGITYSLDKIIIVEQLESSELIGYKPCDSGMLKVAVCKTYADALELLEDITINGYYISKF